MSDPLLTLEGVKTYFPIRKGGLLRRQSGAVRAVDGVSLTIGKGESLGLVGESGCGKSTLSRTILQLQRPTAGKVVFEGRNLADLPERERRRARMDFQMVFQDPFSSLDPRQTIFETIAEGLRRRGDLKRREMEGAVQALMERVGLHPSLMLRYPHEFSGGQRQRVAIARALAPKPRLLVADEPVSSLDVSVQSQILNLLRQLQREEGLAMLFISHDLSVVRHMSDRIAVMYLGKIVELGPAKAVMNAPLHLYTKALLSAVPLLDPDAERGRKRLVLPGEPPSPANPPPGCAFAWRSPKKVSPDIASQAGEWVEARPEHWVELHPATVDNYDNLKAAAGL